MADTPKVPDWLSDLELAKLVLRRLKEASYFTEEEWIRIDGLIHKGAYVFTTGPPKNLMDDSPLLMGMPIVESTSIEAELASLEFLDQHTANPSLEETDAEELNVGSLVSFIDTIDEDSAVAGGAHTAQENGHLIPTVDLDQAAVDSIAEASDSGADAAPRSHSFDSPKNVIEETVSVEATAAASATQTSKPDGANVKKALEKKKNHLPNTSQPPPQPKVPIPPRAVQGNPQVHISDILAKRFVGLEFYAPYSLNPHTDSKMTAAIGDKLSVLKVAGGTVYLAMNSRTSQIAQIGIDFIEAGVAAIAAGPQKSKTNIQAPTLRPNNLATTADIGFIFKANFTLPPQPRKEHKLSFHAGDKIEVLKVVGGDVYLALNQKTGTKGQIFKRFLHAGSLASSHPKKAAAIGTKAYDVDGAEASGAAEWEEGSTSSNVSIAGSSKAKESGTVSLTSEQLDTLMEAKFTALMNARGKPSPSPQKPAPPARSSPPVKTVSIPASPIQFKSEVRALPAARSAPVKTGICGAWADPGRECRFSAEACKANHAFPPGYPNQVPNRPRTTTPSNAAGALGKSPPSRSPKQIATSACVSPAPSAAQQVVKKKEQCFWWATRRDCRYTDSECPRLHAEIEEPDTPGSHPNGWLKVVGADAADKRDVWDQIQPAVVSLDGGDSRAQW